MDVCCFEMDNPSGGGRGRLAGPGPCKEIFHPSFFVKYLKF